MVVGGGLDGGRVVGVVVGGDAGGRVVGAVVGALVVGAVVGEPPLPPVQETPLIAQLVGDPLPLTMKPKSVLAPAGMVAL